MPLLPFFCRDIVRAAFAPLRVGPGRDCLGCALIATRIHSLGRPGLTRQVDASVGMLAHNAEQLPVQLGRPCAACGCQPPWQRKLENVIGPACLQAASLDLCAFLSVLLGCAVFALVAQLCRCPLRMQTSFQCAGARQL
jgi:hypothetical protein